jgi:NADH-quinone oxidoreductase subunit L
LNPTVAIPVTTDIDSLALWALLLAALPLLAFLVLLLAGRKLPRHGDWLAIGATGASCLISVYLFFQVWEKQVLHVRVPWFELGGAGNAAFAFHSGLYLDNLAVLMLVLVTFISLLVQVFSVSYMHGDGRYHHYFAYLGLFTFSMLGIVLADNLLLLFVFWELVGFSSYLLIGFWYQKDAAVKAGKKAFLFNRIGDIGFLLGILFFYAHFHTIDLKVLTSLVQSAATQGPDLAFQLADLPVIVVEYPLLTLAGLGLFMGCVGKSAQFPLQVWLPDAMEGPTPVSSLIHAATMVAAGVYLLSRCLPFFTEHVLLVIAVSGALTTLLGAGAACAQYDIKKILAFSTISQLGYMVMGMGVGAHDAALLHLVTHAFFKAALFLNAGIIIHALHHALGQNPELEADEQDIRNMGGLRRILPLTFYSYLPATAALIGLPLFSGFLSKDAILSGAWAWASWNSAGGAWGYYVIPLAGFASVLLTGFYMARHCFYIFFGQPRLPVAPASFRESGAKEASGFLLIPVVVLAVLSLAFFFSVNPFSYAGSWVLQGLGWQRLLGPDGGIPGALLHGVAGLLQAHDYIGLATAVISVGLAGAGIALGWNNYRQAQAAGTIGRLALPATAPARLAYHHFYLDRLFKKVVVYPFLQLSRGVAGFDEHYIDYTLNSLGKITVVLAKIVGWFDRKAVDGAVHFMAWLAAGIGKVGRGLQNGKIQSYYVFSLLGLILLVIYIIVS